MATSPAGIRRMEKKPVNRAMEPVTMITAGSIWRRLIPQALKAKISRSLVSRVKAIITPVMLAMGMT